MIELDYYQRLAIIAGCAAFVLLVFIIMVCKLTPHCCLYSLCPFRAKYPLEYETTKYKNLQYMYLPELEGKDKAVLTGMQPNKQADPYSPQSEKRWIVDRQSSTEYLSVETTSPEESGTESESYIKKTKPKSVMKLQLHFDETSEKLHIHIEEVSCLPPSYFLGGCDFFVTVVLSVNPDRPKRKRWRRSKEPTDNLVQRREVEIYSKKYKRNGSVHMDENIVLTLQYTEIAKTSLKFIGTESDRYSRSREIGQAVVHLKSLDMSKENSLYLDLETVVNVSAGELLISLTYLPLAERITVTIIKAQGLPGMDNTTMTSNAYVKVLLLHSGKYLSKRKTAIRVQDNSPVFNEALIFDVPANQIDNIMFSISVMHAVSKHGSNSFDKVIGKTWLGRTSGGTAEEHWWEMLKSPRKPVAYWHTLT